MSDDVAGLEHLSISPQQCGPSSHVVMTAPLVVSTLLSKKKKCKKLSSQTVKNCFYALWRKVVNAPPHFLIDLWHVASFTAFRSISLNFANQVPLVQFIQAI